MSVADAERFGVIGRAHRPVEGLKIEGDQIGAKNAPYIDEMQRPARTATAVPLRPNRGPNVTISTPVGRELPEPNFEEEPMVVPEQPLQLEAPAEEAAIHESGGVDPARPYVCSADGKAYKSYTALYRYAKGKYPEQLAGIMAPYKSQANAVPGE